MKFKFLGRNGLQVSAVGLGCMGMSHAYGKPPDNPNHNEEVVGEALYKFRDKVVIATKCGIRFAHPDLQAITTSSPMVGRRQYAVRWRARCADCVPIISTSTISTALTKMWNRK